MIFDKGTKATQQRKKSLHTMMLGIVDIYIPKNEVGSLSYTIINQNWTIKIHF